MSDKKIKDKNTKRLCPCCGNAVFLLPSGSFEICPICFWEDDTSQLENEDQLGANRVSLAQARKNFHKFGVCEKRFEVKRKQ